MKKLLAFIVSLASIGIISTSIETKAAEPSITVEPPQVRMMVSQGRGYNRRVRSVIQTRIVRYGRRVYRETYRVRYFPNGRTRVNLVSRIRIR